MGSSSRNRKFWGGRKFTPLFLFPVGRIFLLFQAAAIIMTLSHPEKEKSEKYPPYYFFRPCHFREGEGGGSVQERVGREGREF